MVRGRTACRVFHSANARCKQLAHGVADGDGLVLGVLGDHPPIQRPHRRVDLHRRQRRHPQVAAHQVVAALAHHVTPDAARLAVAVDAAGHLDGQHPEVGHQLARSLETLDVQDERRQHRRGDGADAGDGVEVVGLGQGAIRRNQQPLQALLPGAASRNWRTWSRTSSSTAARTAKRSRSGRARAAARCACGQVGDGPRSSARGGRQKRGGGVAVDQLQHPARRCP